MGVLILAGQTASGKSALAVDLAQRFDAEIIGADSRQIYRGMAIGTAAPDEAMRARVPHHLIGFLDPRERYSAARFAQDAIVAIDAVHARGKRAIVVGGTGFYLRALVGGVTLHEARDAIVRERLAREALLHPPDVLHAWLVALDPTRARAIEPGDPYRVTRALEIALTRNAPVGVNSVVIPTLQARGVPFAFAYLVVERQLLAERITERVDRMIAAGLLDEARRIGADAVAADAVGYRDALAYESGFTTHAEFRALLIRATTRYAKRQATWFARESLAVRVVPDAVAAFARERLGWG